MRQELSRQSADTRDVTAQYESDELIQMGSRTYMWIDVTTFGITASSSDAQVVEGILAWPGYAEQVQCTYSNSGVDWVLATHQPDFGDVITRGRQVVRNERHHFNWHAASIRAEMFVSCAAAAAEATLRAWAEDQDWPNGFKQPQEHIERVQALLRASDCYRLDNPGEASEISGAFYGKIYNAFHEWIAIDRASAKAHLIVASDD